MRGSANQDSYRNSLTTKSWLNKILDLVELGEVKKWYILYKKDKYSHKAKDKNSWVPVTDLPYFFALILTFLGEFLEYFLLIQKNISG